MKCPVCDRRGAIEDTICARVESGYKELAILVERFPQILCPNCNKSYADPANLQKLKELVEEAVKGRPAPGEKEKLVMIEFWSGNTVTFSDVPEPDMENQG